MDKAKFEEIAGRLEEVSQLVSKLDPAVRSKAFELLLPYVSGGGARASLPESNLGQAADMADAESFFQKFNHDKPADNAFALAAYHYSQYGWVVFTAAEMRALASEVGLTIPDRIDSTYEAAQREGKSLFLKMGKGQYKPTVHGESFFKKTYEVAKGTKKKLQGEE